MWTFGWLAPLLSIGGALESAVGLGLLVAPAAVARFLLRTPLTDSGAVVARLAGGGLLGLGIACWCARATPLAPAALGVAWGLLVYNVVACLVLFRARPPLAGGGLAALGASLLHGLLAVALTLALLGRGTTASPP